MISKSTTEWTKVRLSRQDNIKFNLNSFHYFIERPHIYKIVNPENVELIVSNTDALSGNYTFTVSGNSFNNISYVEFWAIKTTDYTTKWKLEKINVSY